MFFALTITNNYRTADLFHDLSIIQEIISKMEATGHLEIGHLGYELTPHKPHLMHIHCMISAKRTPYMKRFARKGINFLCEKLEGDTDVAKWVAYCHKQDSFRHLIFENEELYIKKLFNKFEECMFSPKAPPEQDLNFIPNYPMFKRDN